MHRHDSTQAGQANDLDHASGVSGGAEAERALVTGDPTKAGDTLEPDATDSRRGFLVSAGWASALLALGARQARAQDKPGMAGMGGKPGMAGMGDKPGMAGMGEKPGMAGMGEKPAMAGMGNKPGGMRMNPLVDRFPREAAKQKLSPPPALVGKQMGRVETVGQPALGYELDGDVKVFTLIAQPIELTITEGKDYADPDVPDPWQRFLPRQSRPKKCLAWGYNGMSPGPTLEATEGDRVRVVFKNELPEPTSIHWHGFELPFSEDGASGYNAFEARRPILPGATETYEFELIQSGTLMYHTGFNVMKQEALGLGGFFVIHPKEEERKPDHDFAIMLQQWTFAPGNPNPNVNEMEPSFATFNGKTAPSFPMLRVKQGDRVRIRFGNLSLLYHPIHIHGHVFEIVGTTGGPIPKSARWKEVTVDVPPGTTRDIELVAWNPGTWRMHCHVLHHVMNQMPDMPMGIAPPEGMFSHLRVEPKDPSYDPKDRATKWTYPPKEER